MTPEAALTHGGNMEISVQVANDDGTWSVLNSRRLRPGMTDVERAGYVTEIAHIYDGWLTSDYTRNRHVRLHVEVDDGI